jgi:hypothetical protein
VAITELFAGIPVSDFATAREWYERLIGRPPDLVPHDAEAAGPVETMPGAATRAVVTDPDGNEIAFGQPLG